MVKTCIFFTLIILFEVGNAFCSDDLIEEHLFVLRFGRWTQAVGLGTWHCAVLSVDRMDETDDALCGGLGLYLKSNLFHSHIRVFKERDSYALFPGHRGHADQSEPMICKKRIPLLGSLDRFEGKGRWKEVLKNSMIADIKMIVLVVDPGIKRKPSDSVRDGVLL